MEGRSTLVGKNDYTGLANGLEIVGGEKVKSAIMEFSKYGLISFSRQTQFKSTAYSIHFFKPISKLKQLYNLGDEMLILCCKDNFVNFKSRTKDYLDFLLATSSEFKNRLDKLTCFLIDDCDNIAELVKKDRMDNPDARLIVPFSYDELCDGLTDDVLQARLRSFLYERDLFGVASPLQNENMFFGKDRTNVISELYGKYKQGEHGGLFGLRRIGKTSILNLLKQRVEQAGGVVFYFDCTKYHHLRWNEFLRQIIDDLQEKYAFEPDGDDGISLPNGFKIDTDKNDYSGSHAALSFEKDIKHLFNAFSQQRILLIFDEVEQISFETSSSEHWKSGNDALYFWQTLRSISQTDRRLLSFVITGVNPKCIESSKINGNDNPIFNALTPQYITLFDYDDVKTMISDIGGHLGLSFDEEIYGKLVDDYGGHPFLTRQVCSRINSDVLNKNELRPYKVSKFGYDKRADDYRTQMEAVIKQILGVLEDYYPDEYELLKTLALQGSSYFKRSLTYGDSSIAHLLGYCLIKKESDDYYIRIKSIGEYLKNKHRNDAVLTEMEQRRERISRRRGELENKLRSIIAYNLKTKYGKKSVEWLCKILSNTATDKTQASKLQKLDLKQAMSELYFSQLKILIEDDWKKYQEIFEDRVKFGQFFDIINRYRVDAHAKPISDEDEALLNIAFKYFESKLSDL